jgi:1,4-alpha-glucan branching enzyme
MISSRAPSPRAGAATAGAGARPKRVVSPVIPRSARGLAIPGGAGPATQQQRPPSRGGEEAARHVAAAAAAPAAAAANAEPVSSSSLPLLDRDPGLRPHEGHLSYRWRRYLEAKAAIASAVEGAKRDGGESAGGGGGGGGGEGEGDAVAAFASSYRTWGLQRAPGRVTLREWIPGASAVALIGDFNNWQPRDGLDWAQRDAFGVWTLSLPDDGGDEKSGGGGGGAPAVAHGSRYKLRVQSAAGGWWADRVSAWARYATAPQGQMGATFDGVAWWPEEKDRHRWLHPRPAPIGDGNGGGSGGGGNNGGPALRIYEAHVGMSSEREEVATYRYFAEEVLPRVKAQGYNAVQLMAVQVRRGGGSAHALLFVLLSFALARAPFAHPLFPSLPTKNQTTNKNHRSTPTTPPSATTSRPPLPSRPAPARPKT